MALTTGNATLYQYTIIAGLYGDLAPITTEMIKKKLIIQQQTLGKIPNLTWIDTPTTGTHSYEIRITVTATDIAGTAQTRSINATLFG